VRNSHTFPCYVGRYLAFTRGDRRRNYNSTTSRRNRRLLAFLAIVGATDRRLQQSPRVYTTGNRSAQRSLRQLQRRSPRVNGLLHVSYTVVH